MNRIVVIGTSCSGKSTLAKRVAQRLDHPYVELDALFWGPNWTPREEFEDDVDRATSGDCWVADGNYQKVRHLTWARADTIIWLDYPLRIVMQRALRRSIPRAIRGDELWAGNRESLRLTFLDKDSILLWVIRTWRRLHAQNPKLLRIERDAGKRIIRLREPSEADRWLAEL